MCCPPPPSLRWRRLPNRGSPGVEPLLSPRPPWPYSSRVWSLPHPTASSVALLPPPSHSSSGLEIPAVVRLVARVPAVAARPRPFARGRVAPSFVVPRNHSAPVVALHEKRVLAQLPFLSFFRSPICLYSSYANMSLIMAAATISCPTGRFKIVVVVSCSGASWLLLSSSFDNTCHHWIAVVWWDLHSG